MASLEKKYTCTTCGIQGYDFKACGRCLTPRYCSRKCQCTDWKGHKKNCVPLKIQFNELVESEKNGFPEFMLFIKKRANSKSKKPLSSKEFDEMMSSLTKLGVAAKNGCADSKRHLDEIVKVSHEVYTTGVPQHFNFWTSKDLKKVVNKCADGADSDM